MQRPDSQDIIISVVIPTYNRSECLKRALKSMCEQTVDPQTFEIIVVDNASTDHTASIVSSFIEQGWTQLRYVYEHEQGLSVARNTGAKHAHGEYVAYMDDDAMADPQWVRNLRRCVQKLNPDAVGGPIFPYYLDEKPDWFLDRYEVRQITTQSRYLVRGEFLSGSNMTYRRKVLETLNGFDPNFGMKGGRQGWGEETDLIFRYFDRTNHPMLYYSKDVVVYHLVPSWKMNLWKRWKSTLVTTGKGGLQAHHLKHSRWLCAGRIAKHIPFLVWDVLAGQYIRNRSVYPYRQNYLYEVALRRTRNIVSNFNYFCDF